MSKSILRLELQKRRGVVAARDAESAAAAVCKFFFENVPVPEGGTIAGYWPIRTELDVRPVLLEAARRGFKTALPVIAGDYVEFCLWSEGDRLTKEDRFGVPEPENKTRVVVPDIILTPLVAYDEAGYRLGYGAGFYDRTLQKLRAAGRIVAVGTGYAAQKVKELPRDPHDQPLDWIITEKGAQPYS